MLQIKTNQYAVVLTQEMGKRYVLTITRDLDIKPPEQPKAYKFICTANINELLKALNAARAKPINEMEEKLIAVLNGLSVQPIPENVDHLAAIAEDSYFKTKLPATFKANLPAAQVATVTLALANGATHIPPTGPGKSKHPHTWSLTPTAMGARIRSAIDKEKYVFDHKEGGATFPTAAVSQPVLRAESNTLKYNYTTTDSSQSQHSQHADSQATEKQHNDEEATPPLESPVARASTAKASTTKAVAKAASQPPTPPKTPPARASAAAAAGALRTHSAAFFQRQQSAAAAEPVRRTRSVNFYPRVLPRNAVPSLLPQTAAGEIQRKRKREDKVPGVAAPTQPGRTFSSG